MTDQPSLPCVFTADGQENVGKCPHQDSDGSDTSFCELSNGTELKSPDKVDGDGAGLNCNGADAPTPGTPGSVAGAGTGTGTGSGTDTSPKAKAASAAAATVDTEKKHHCMECGQAFRTKSYLNKHLNRVHGMVGMGKGGGVGGAASLLGDISSPTLGSPFSPQQNMSLLESFGFQIVQSAFASSLVDSEAGGDDLSEAK